MRKSIFITVLLALVVLQQGCSIHGSIGGGVEAYYPTMKTKAGGTFGDPEKSRHEATRSTVGHVRNNDGGEESGNKVDAALRRFFKVGE